MDTNQFLIELQAILNKEVSKGNIDKSIMRLQDQIQKLQLQVEINPKDLLKLKTQIEKVTNQKIKIPNISFDSGNAIKEAQKAAQQITNASTATTTAIIQNEERKQQAIQKTANVQKQISKDESLIKSGLNAAAFDNTIDAARVAAKHFKELLKNENAVISVSEQFGKTNSLASFTVNVKRATGEVESLRYALSEIKDVNGKGTGQSHFINKGGTINDSNAKKQVQQIENAFANYTQKLAQFKSTNNNILSGLSAPLSDFENKLAGLRNGTVTIDELRNSFSMLKAEASKITSNLSGDLNKVDKAVRNISKGKETIASLRAEFNGLHSTPKDINSEITKLSTGLQNIKKIEAQEGRSANWSKAYKEWEIAVDSLNAKLKVLKKEQSNVANTQVFKTSDLRKAKIPYMSKVFNTTEKQMAEIQKMANVYGWQKFDVKGIEQADGLIKKLTLTVTDAEGAIKRLNFQRAQLLGNGKTQAGLMQTGDVQVLKTASRAQEELAQKTSNANAKLDEQRVKLVNKIQLSFDTGAYESKVDSLIARTRQWTDASGNAKINTNNLNIALENLNKAQTALSQNNSVANQNALIAAEKELDIEVKKVTNSIKKMNSETMKSSAVDSLRQKVQQFYDINGKSHRKFGVQLKSIIAQLGQGMDVPIAKGRELEQEFIRIQNAARQAGLLGKGFFQTLKEGMSSFSYWTSSTFIVMKTLSEIRQAVTTVKELDTALVDLKKTTTMTSKELEQFYYDANDVAKQMGVTTKEIIDQASAFSRLGYNSKEAATQMAKYSSWFKTISPGMSIEQAGDTLTSVMKAFKYDVQDVEKIMSMINTVGNNFAVSNADISEILTRSSSAMKEANNSLADTIALGTAATEITRDAASVGNALKTISMRIRGYDEETEEYIGNVEELSGKIADLTKTASTPGGISLFTDEAKTEYKSTKQLLLDIGEIYQDLTDKEQAGLLEALAGKRQGQIVAAMLNNLDTVTESINKMETDTDSASKELEIALDSIEVKWGQLKESGVGVSQNLFQRDDMKSVIESLTSVMEVIDALTSKLGLFGTIGFGAGLFAGWKNVGSPKMYGLNHYCFENANSMLVLLDTVV